MKQFILILLFLSASARAEEAMPLKIFNVGEFDGVRIMVPCSLNTPDGHCFLDTAGSISILRELPEGAVVTGKDQAGGIGWKTDCDQAYLPSFKLGGLEIPNFEFSNCPTFEESFSPLIGMNALWGRRFDVDFGENTLTWKKSPMELSAFTVWAGGPSSRWITMNASFAGAEFPVAWDTGAPVTLVSPAFVGWFPEYFEEETTRGLPRNMQKSGGKAYRVKKPFVINGVELNAEFVHAIELDKFFGNLGGIPVILGTNHMRKANWSFDLGMGQAQVIPKAKDGPQLPDRF